MQIHKEYSMHKTCTKSNKITAGKGEGGTKLHTNQEDIMIDSWRRKISFLQCDTLSVSKHSRTDIVLVNYSITQHICVYVSALCLCMSAVIFDTFLVFIIV